MELKDLKPNDWLVEQIENRIWFKSYVRSPPVENDGIWEVEVNTRPGRFYRYVEKDGKIYRNDKEVTLMSKKK